MRVPFLNQAIQGDDFYYLKGAEHALVDPLHPTHARYVFLGEMVDMRGHPHPPLNAWCLAALVWAFGEESELPFHAAYTLFSIIAALSAWAIAKRFGKRPLLAAVLFLLTPAFVVNGNSLESDLPFLAFWLAAIAGFVWQRWWVAAGACVLASLAAYQTIILAPILAWWLIVNKKHSVPAWTAVAAAPLTIVCWQAFERLSSGALPATVLAGYMNTYNLQALAQKLKNAAALTGHAGWLVFPVLALASFRRIGFVLFGVAVGLAGAFVDPNPLFWASAATGAMVIAWCVIHARRNFLAAWVAIFFAAALVIFFAGAARYLLPIALPVAILASDRMQPRWIAAGAAAQGVLSFGLAIVNYQHWGGYREFARSLSREIATRRTWTNAEWGLRHYLEREGAMPVQRGRSFWPNDLVVATSYAAEPQTGPTAAFAEHTITSAIPLRIVAPGVDSAYSSISFGLAPFGISPRPMDVVRAAVVLERKAELSRLEIGTPAAAAQIVSGVYNNDRWTTDRATVMLKRPDNASRVEAKIFVPPQATARNIQLLADGKLIREEKLPGPGVYTIAGIAYGNEKAVTITIEADMTFSVLPDQRRLGVVLLSVGFAEP